jgi:cytochrome c peroxidase
LFHDGRVETDPNGYYEGGFVTPAKWKLPTGLDNVLAAQAMFPVTSHLEMAGQKGENSIADAASLNNAAGKGGVWEQIANRLQEIPEYVNLFKAAFPDEIKTAEDISYVHAANSIATFQASSFRVDDSPFDRFLRGDKNSLSAEQTRGMELFYGKAGCNSCHAGKFQTDHEFHSIAMPQIGPGKADGRHGSYWRATGHTVFLEDFGRGRVTVRREDAYKFRTPSLRNTALTGPWGHAGSFVKLEDVLRHHLDPVASLNAYALQETDLPPIGKVLEVTVEGSSLDQNELSDGRQEGFLKRDSWVQSDPELRQSIAESNELKPMALSDTEISELLAFLHALTDTTKNMSELVPEKVPSGLIVVD